MTQKEAHDKYGISYGDTVILVRQQENGDKIERMFCAHLSMLPGSRHEVIMSYITGNCALLSDEVFDLEWNAKEVVERKLGKLRKTETLTFKETQSHETRN